MNRPPRSSRGFSLVEVLVSLVILGTLMAATITALDTSFKAYKSTTESASTNVVARMVVHRVSAMIRGGVEFGPYPADVLDSAQNPATYTYMEFNAGLNPGNGATRIIRLERRTVAAGSQAPYELWYVENEVLAGVVTLIEERPLLTDIKDLTFTLEYDVGPRLRRATIDLTVKPNDYQDASFSTQLETPTVRLVASVCPRRLEERF
ncbi:MAG TPA: prepilin-type N-terminal cleavage/methylation domain-containing protein [Phycisphaerales bacterium]|nr:prepilin-type N-terminal cleavage/methylation domain-containing protein [Phycisphaerales bacterium]